MASGKSLSSEVISLPVVTSSVCLNAPSRVWLGTRHGNERMEVEEGGVWSCLGV